MRHARVTAEVRGISIQYEDIAPERAFIRVHGGRMVNIADPINCRHEDHVWEVAHALANTCRFTGHVRQFYSVAQHAVNCSNCILDPSDVDPVVAYERLHHDDQEAYYGDMASPLKRLRGLRGYRELEQSAARMPDGLVAGAVHAADSAMCRRELYDLFRPPYGESDSWVAQITRTWTPIEAEIRYLLRHFGLLRQMGESTYRDGDLDREIPRWWQVVARVIRGRML